MKNSMKILVLLGIVATVCGTSSGKIEIPKRSDQVGLIGYSHPGLLDMERVLVKVRQTPEPNEPAEVLEELESQIKEKLQQIGLRTEFKAAGKGLSVPILIVDVYTLRLSNPQDYVLSVRTTLSRAIRLAQKKRPIFRANVWKLAPETELVSVGLIRSKVAELALAQTDIFIDAWRMANSKAGRKTKPPMQDNKKDKPKKKGGYYSQELKTDAAEQQFAASRKGNVFHKPDCPWAKKITERNLVSYENREEAVDGGKRPCKRCKP